jgi:hypothetical protein
VVLGQGYVVPPSVFQGEKRIAPNHFLAPPKLEKYIKGICWLFYYFSKYWNA